MSILETIQSYLSKYDSLECIHKNVKENEVFLLFRKNKENANVNVNELVQHISTKLSRQFAVTNVKQSIQTNRNVNSFKLPNRKKIEYRYTSIARKG